LDILAKIQELLEMQGKSQTDLTNALGLKQPAFSEWKSGKSASYKKYLYQIADYFGVTADYLRGDPKKAPASSGEPTGVGEGVDFERELSSLLVRAGYPDLDSLSQGDRDFLASVIGLLEAHFKREQQ
jgi:transcriptional regulator with XRE-family HTH domain